MKRLILIQLLFFSLTFFSSCGKESECVTATITQTGTPCSWWAINVGTIYVSNNIPDQFKQEGLQVCVEYELYDDPAVCPCCGGTHAKILSMSFTE